MFKLLTITSYKQFYITIIYMNASYLHHRVKVDCKTINCPYYKTVLNVSWLKLLLERIFFSLSHGEEAINIRYLPVLDFFDLRGDGIRTQLLPHHCTWRMLYVARMLLDENITPYVYVL